MTITPDEETPIVVIEFYPSPWGSPEAEHGKCWENIRTVMHALTFEYKAKYTGVKGPDCYFDIFVPEGKHGDLMLELAMQPLIEEFGLETVRVLDVAYPDSIRAKLPLATRQRRQRR